MASLTVRTILPEGYLSALLRRLVWYLPISPRILRENPEA
jgi:hypothetical protein